MSDPITTEVVTGTPATLPTAPSSTRSYRASRPVAFAVVGGRKTRSPAVAVVFACVAMALLAVVWGS